MHGRAWNMTRRSLIGSLVICTALALVGCTTRRQGVDMSGFKTAMASPVSGFGGNGEAPPSNVMSKPETVVLARVSAHARANIDSSRSRYTGEGGRVYGDDGQGRVTFDSREQSLPNMPWVVDEGVNDRQDLVALSGAKSSRVVLMSQLVNTPTRMATYNIMETARQRGAQWLCVFSAQTEYEEMMARPSWVLQVLTLGLMPTASDAKSEIDMMIIDLQSNTIVDQWRSTETGWQPAVGLTYKDASEQSADRAETRAMRAVMQRLDRRIKGEAEFEPRRGNAGMWE